VYYDVLNAGAILDGFCGANGSSLGDPGVLGQREQPGDGLDMVADAFGSDGDLKVADVADEGPIENSAVFVMLDLDFAISNSM